MAEEELLSIAQAAASCRVDEETIRRWIRNGHIPYTLVTRSKIKKITKKDLLGKKGKKNV